MSKQGFHIKGVNAPQIFLAAQTDCKHRLNVVTLHSTTKQCLILNGKLYGK